MDFKEEVKPWEKLLNFLNEEIQKYLDEQLNINSLHSSNKLLLLDYNIFFKLNKILNDYELKGFEPKEEDFKKIKINLIEKDGDKVFKIRNIVVFKIENTRKIEEKFNFSIKFSEIVSWK